MKNGLTFMTYLSRILIRADFFDFKINSINSNSDSITLNLKAVCKFVVKYTFLQLTSYCMLILKL